MKISGFTIVRNAIKYDYPIVEAILSILPICDEVIVAVGKSEDATLELIRSISSPKIKIIETIWDERLREGGKVLADETNKAFAAVAKDSDWAFYIQGDEVIHEKYLETIRKSAENFKDDKNVEGLLFNYTHFYGSYDFIGDSRRWYRREIRMIRNDKSISSYGDAQGFRKKGEKLKVKHIDAFVYHYGWVKPPAAQQAKQQTFNKLWHDDAWMKKNVPDVAEFDYTQTDSVAVFRGTHPKVMQERINKMNWKFSFDPTQKKLSFKVRLLMFIEKTTGWKVGEYRNYKLLGIFVFIVILSGSVLGQAPKEGFAGSKSSSTILDRYEVLNKNSDVRNGHSEKWYRGVKIVSCEYLNGKKNGLWKSQSVDGTVFFQGNYSDDKKDGSWKYYLKQKRLCVIYYKDDKKDSTWQSYFPNGNLRYVKTYKDDIQTGPCTLYYENGKVKQLSNYVSDEIDGNFITYHENGVVLSNIEFRNGRPMNVVEMKDSSGANKDIGTFRNGNGKLIEYLPGGQKKIAAYYENGLRHGMTIRYFENGQICSEENFDQGYKDGSSSYYQSNGTLHYSHEYMNGAQVSSYNNEKADPVLMKKDRDETSRSNEDFVEETPISLGGEEGLWSFIQANFNAPESAKTPGQQGTIYTTFIVTTDGKTKDVKILKGISPALDEEALNVIKKLPPWIPGFVNGLPVNVQFNLPITYTLRY